MTFTLQRTVLLTAAALLTLGVAGCAAAESTQISKNPPMKDFGTVMVACMSEKGWEVSTDYTNSIFLTDVKNGIPPEQASRYEEDRSSCVSKYGFNEPRVPTDAQLSELYELEVEARECMISEGYSLPEMPSLLTFKENYGKADGWDPVKYITPGDPYADQLLFTKCPPPGWFLPF